MGSSLTGQDVSEVDAQALERADGDLARVFGDGRRPLPVMRESLDEMMSSFGLPEG